MKFPQIAAFSGAPSVIRLVGHRGARGIMPENTIEGFEFALKTGVELLELDVTNSGDGVPVVTHNHRLTGSVVRDSNGAWLSEPEPKVSSLPYAELLQHDVGGLDGHSEYGQRFPDQAFLSDIRIPRLAEVLELLRQPEHQNAHLLLEIKSDPDFLHDVVARENLVRSVVEVVRQTGLQMRTVLHSFDWGLLTLCQRIAPEIPVSFLTQQPENAADKGEDSSQEVNPIKGMSVMDLPEMIAKASGQFWCPYYLDITPQSLARARELRLKVVVWTVNEPRDIENMIELGVDAICSDYPGRVQRQLLCRGLHWQV